MKFSTKAAAVAVGLSVASMGVSVNGATPVLKLDCDPCIERETFKVSAFYHGSSEEGFWQQLESAAIQTGADLGIELETMLLAGDSDEMASKIRTAIAESPNAMVVTIPDDTVASAVQEAIDAGIPVFGCNAGYERFKEMGGLGWVAQDEFMAGQYAGNMIAEILGINGTQTQMETETETETDIEMEPPMVGEDSIMMDENTTVIDDDTPQTNATISNATIDSATRIRARTLTHTHTRTHTQTRDLQNAIPQVAILVATNDTAMEARADGLLDILGPMGVPPTVISLDRDQDQVVLAAQITAAFETCPYDFLIAPDAEHIASIGMIVNCENMMIGSFDESPATWAGIADGSIAFGISQQQYLQGVLPVLLAASFATTERIPAIPLDNPNGAFLSGPVLIDSTNLPDEDQQKCILDAFPVCPNTGANGCPCTDRSSIKIGGSLHGITTDDFWNPVYAAADQAAKDVGVTFDNERFDPQANSDILHLKMNAKIEALCEAGVDGVFVTIPSDLVVPGLQKCSEENIPVIAVNAGVTVVESMGLMHYVGQLAFNAGFAAAEEMVKAGTTKIWCLNHAPEVETTVQRCNGMEEYLSGVDSAEYMGQVDVPPDNDTKYILDVQTAVNDNGDWDGFGFVLLGQVQVPPCIQLLEEHPKMSIGSFDLSTEIFDGLDIEDILYGIDQQPFVQGYFPVPLLTYFAQSNQRLLNLVVQSGPSFVFVSPSAEKSVCEANYNKVCSDDDANIPDFTSVDSNEDDDEDETDDTTGESGVGRREGTIASFVALMVSLLFA